MGTAISVPLFAIYHINGYPAMVGSDEGVGIYGELYEVAEEHFMGLDRYEDVAHGLFCRKEISLLEITLCNLPVSQEVLQKVQTKKAETYLYLQSVDGARNLGNFFSLVP